MSGAVELKGQTGKLAGIILDKDASDINKLRALEEISRTYPVAEITEAINSSAEDPTGKMYTQSFFSYFMLSPQKRSESESEAHKEIVSWFLKYTPAIPDFFRFSQNLGTQGQKDIPTTELILDYCRKQGHLINDTGLPH